MRWGKGRCRWVITLTHMLGRNADKYGQRLPSRGLIGPGRHNLSIMSRHRSGSCLNLTLSGLTIRCKYSNIGCLSRKPLGQCWKPSSFTYTTFIPSGLQLQLRSHLQWSRKNLHIERSFHSKDPMASMSQHRL